MFCKFCGKEVVTDASVCIHCGRRLDYDKSHNYDKDGGNAALWGILGFFVPLAGLILFLVWRKERPKDAKAVGLGALVSVAFEAAVIIIVAAVYIILVPLMMYFNGPMLTGALSLL